MLETELRRRYMAACAPAFPNLRLFVRNVGFFKTQGGGGFRAGIKGQADVTGVFRDPCAVQTRFPIPIEIELKRSGKRLTPEQEHWRDWCKEWGIPYLLLEEKYPADPKLSIKTWVDETRAFLETL
jgi:hypothetical protein